MVLEGRKGFLEVTFLLWLGSCLVSGPASQRDNPALSRPLGRLSPTSSQASRHCYHHSSLLPGGPSVCSTRNPGQKWRRRGLSVHPLRHF